MKAQFVLVLVVAFALSACAKKQKVTMLEDSIAEQVTLPDDGSAAKGASTAEARSFERSPIFFDYNSSDLSDSSRDRLAKLAGALAQNDDLTLTIEGNTDSRGSTEYNLALGERRARAARDYLSRSGVRAQRVELISYGEERPLVTGATEDAYARNRRDDFRLSD